MRLRVTKVFEKLHALYTAGEHRQIVAMGGSRSSKSWSILQLFIMILAARSGVLITVWRNTAKDCRATVRRDFRNILALDPILFNSFAENKTESTFTHKGTGSQIVFEGADDIGKVLGLAQTISFFNEVTEFNEDVYLQITQRTAETIFCDYNPSKNFWLERYRNDSRTVFNHSTYLDNAFCPEEIRNQLNSYNPNIPENVEAGTANEYMYQVYCLGVRAEKPNKIYHGWKTIPDAFFDKIPSESYFGLDFGLSSPNALVEVKFDGERTFYVRELLYRSTNDLKIDKTTLSNTLKVIASTLIDNGNLLVADSAKMASVTELVGEGFSAVPALKGPGSLEAGITFLQEVNVCYTRSSQNLEAEYDSYSYEVKGGVQFDKPERHQDDHLLDAFRYCAFYLKRYLGIQT